MLFIVFAFWLKDFGISVCKIEFYKKTSIETSSEYFTDRFEMNIYEFFDNITVFQCFGLFVEVSCMQKRVVRKQTVYILPPASFFRRFWNFDGYFRTYWQTERAWYLQFLSDNNCYHRFWTLSCVDETGRGRI